MWASHPTFMDLVRGSWELPFYASPMCTLVGKLKRLKQELKEWNKNVFGNLFRNLSAAEDNVLAAQQKYD